MDIALRNPFPERPPDLQAQIEESFRRVYDRPERRSKWGFYNGDSTYNICGVSEFSLLRSLIQKTPLTEKNIYVLDIGAGNFQLINYLSKKTNKIVKGLKRRDIRIHYIGVRGERCSEKPIVVRKYYTIYKLGGFKIEDILLQFKKLGLDFENKINIALSRWCFRHLTDPVGTFMQTLQLLSPKMNYFLLDGFFYLYEGERLKHLDARLRMVEFFLEEMKLTFLKRSWTIDNCLDQFIVQITEDYFPHTPMTYLRMKTIKHKKFVKYDVNSTTVVYFDRPSGISIPKELLLGDASFNILSGDRSIFEIFQAGKMIPSFMKWHPLFQNTASSLILPELAEERIGDPITEIPLL